MTFTKPNKTKKQTPHDLVMTSRSVARAIIDHFKPRGSILDPCMGEGAFFKQFENDEKDWCEIAKGRDFFDYGASVDWIITNPPFSIYDEFLLKALEVADNVVFLVPLAKAFKSRKIDDAIIRYGGLREILMLGAGNKVGFSFGFPVGCLHYKRGYRGKTIRLTRKYEHHHSRG